MSMSKAGDIARKIGERAQRQTAAPSDDERERLAREIAAQERALYNERAALDESDESDDVDSDAQQARDDESMSASAAYRAQLAEHASANGQEHDEHVESETPVAEHAPDDAKSASEPSANASTPDSASATSNESKTRVATVPSLFKRAERYGFPVKVLVSGVTKSGKSVAALALASQFGRVAVIETEANKTRMHADKFAFDVLTLSEFNVEHALDIISNAEHAGYDVLVVDSLSAFWQGRGGVLDMKDARSKSSGDFGAWRDITPLQRRFIDALIYSPLHVVATARVKMDYVVTTDGRGKSVPQRVGLAPILRDDTPSEFDIEIKLDDEHALAMYGKCDKLDGFTALGVSGDLSVYTYIGSALKEWSSGAPMPSDVVALMRDARNEKTPLAQRPQQAQAQRAATSAQRPQQAQAQRVPAVRDWPTLFNALALKGKRFKSLDVLKTTVSERGLTPPTSASDFDALYNELLK